MLSNTYLFCINYMSYVLTRIMNEVFVLADVFFSHIPWTAQNTAYIPPAKRAAMLGESGQRSLELERLKKQMKGLLNR